MAFKLSSTGEYSVRLLTYLAAYPTGTIIPAKEIAKAREIPLKYLQQIISRFVKMGHLTGHPGLGGGVSLPESAFKLTLLEVIEAAEGPIFLNRCLMGPMACTFTVTCAVHQIWHEAQTAFLNTLGSKTILELAQTNISLAQSELGQSTNLPFPGSIPTNRT